MSGNQGYPEHIEHMPRLPEYEYPPPWIPYAERMDHPDYNTDHRQFLPRKIQLIRERASEALGFNIRGGREHYCGVYVSKVMPNSEADRLGLKEADQILLVNDIDFESIDHSEAVKILKINTNIHMVVRYFPYATQRKCTILEQLLNNLCLVDQSSPLINELITLEKSPATKSSQRYQTYQHG